MNHKGTIIAALNFSGQMEPEVTKKYMNYWDDLQNVVSL